MSEAVRMPELGGSSETCTILQWLKQPGDPVAAGDALLEVETDKVSSEIAATTGGVLLEIVIPEGETVRKGDVLARIGQPGEQPVQVPAANNVGAVEPQPAAPAALPTLTPVAARVATAHGIDPVEITGSGQKGRIRKADVLAATLPTRAAPPAPEPVSSDALLVSPVVRQLLAAHRISPATVRGSGKGGRLKRSDVLTYIDAHHLTPVAPAPAPTVSESRKAAPAHSVSAPATSTASTAPRITAGVDVPVTGMRRAIAQHMLDSVQTSPQAMVMLEIDMQAVSEHRQRHKAALAERGIPLTFTAYFVVAAARALRACPNVNARWDGETIHLHRDVHIGIATSLGRDGLLVPVLRHADEQSLAGVARQISQLSEAARSRSLDADALSGATFTITNHGSSGSLLALPIINQPQAAILGTGRITRRAAVIGDAIGIRPMCFASLTFDHRLLDGASADEFLNVIKDALENWSIDE